MSKVLDSIKAALQIAFGLVILAIILLNFQDLYLAMRKLLEQSASVRAIKALGVEIDLSTTGVDRALSLPSTRDTVPSHSLARILPAWERTAMSLIEVRQTSRSDSFCGGQRFAYHAQGAV